MKEIACQQGPPPPGQARLTKRYDRKMGPAVESPGKIRAATPADFGKSNPALAVHPVDSLKRALQGSV